jgi:hypothetical protein
MKCHQARLLLFGVIVGVWSTAGCSENAPTAPSPVLVTDTFTGVISPLGSASHVFTINYTEGLTEASFAVTSLITVADATPQTVTIGVGFGSVSLGVCTRSPSYSNPAVPLNTELSTAGGTFGPGQACVEVYDNPDGPTVTEPLTYTVAVKHY